MSEKELPAMDIGISAQEPIDLTGMDRGDTFEPETPAEIQAEAPAEKPAEAPAEKPAETPEEKPAEAPEEKPAEAPEEKPAEAQAETTGEKKKVDNRIPQERFNEVNERRKAAEKKLAELEANQEAKQQGAEETFDYDAKEGEYMEAVIDGRLDDARKIRAEIRTAENAAFELKLQQTQQRTIEESTNVTQEKLLFDNTVKELEKTYDVINPDSENFDAEIATEIVELRDAYRRSGLTLSTALRKATRIVALDRGLTPNTTGVGETPAEQTPATKQPSAKELEKKIAAAASQPEHMDDGSATAETTIDVMSMTDAEFAKLSEADIKRLRGDVFLG